MLPLIRSLVFTGKRSRPCLACVDDAHHDDDASAECRVTSLLNTCPCRPHISTSTAQQRGDNNVCDTTTVFVTTKHAADIYTHTCIPTIYIKQVDKARQRHAFVIRHLAVFDRAFIMLQHRARQQVVGK